MNKKAISILSSLAFGLFFAASVPAATLVAYNFTGSNDNASSIAANTSASALSIGVSGTEFGTVGDGATGNGWSTGAVSNTGTGSPAASSPTRFIRVGNLTGSESAAVAADDYFQFTLTPGGGFAASLTSLTLDIASTAGSTGGTIFNTANWFLRSGVDSFGATLGTAGPITQFAAPSASIYSRFTIDLSGAAFQNLSGPVTFRLYTYSLNNNAAGLNRLDNIILNGDIASVPEPSACVLLGAGLGALWMLRRRRAA